MVKSKLKSNKIYLSFSVNIGTLLDPKEYKGITHIIEHMIFRGSSKYKTNKFTELIEKYNGYSNAETSSFYTIYYLSFDKEGIEEILNLTIDSLTNPLFLRSELKKEINNINSELLMREISDDTFDIYNLLKHLSNNSTNVFNDGFQFFDSNNKKEISNIYNLVKDYFKKYYNNNNINAAILSDMNFEEIENIIIKKINKLIIGDKLNSEKLNIDNKIFYNEDYKSFYFIKTNNIGDKLTILFDIKHNFKSKIYLKLISFFINLDHLGSLKYILQIKNNWVNRMEDNIETNNYKRGIYSITFELTETGIDNIKNIIKYFYKYINELKNIDNNFLNKLKYVSKQIFYMDHTSDYPFLDILPNSKDNFIIDLSQKLFHIKNDTEIISENKILDNINLTHLNNLIDNINFNNSLIVFTSNRFKTGNNTIIEELPKHMSNPFNHEINNLKNNLEKINKLENGVANSTLKNQNNNELYINNNFTINFTTNVNVKLSESTYYKKYKINNSEINKIINFYNNSSNIFKIKDDIKIRKFDSIIYSEKCTKNKKITDILNIKDIGLLNKDELYEARFNLKNDEKIIKINNCIKKEFNQNLLLKNANLYKLINSHNIYEKLYILEFNVFTNIHIEIYSGFMYNNINNNNNLENMLLLNMFIKYFNKIISLKYLDDIISGHKIKINTNNNNLTVNIYGYSGSSISLFENIIDNLLKLEIKEDLFVFIKNNYFNEISKIQNLNNIDYALNLGLNTLNKLSFDYNDESQKDNINIFFKTVDITIFKIFIINYFKNIKTSTIITGNYSNKDLVRLVNFIIVKFDAFNDLNYKFNIDIFDFNLKLTNKKDIKIVSKNMVDTNNVFLLSLELGISSNKHKIIISLINQMLNKIVFDEFRNKKNMGYVSNSFISSINFINYQFVIIEGENFSPDDISLELDYILKKLHNELKYFNKGELISKINNIIKSKINIPERYNKILKLITSNTISNILINDNTILTELIDKITKVEILDFYTKFYLNNNSKLNIKIINYKNNTS